MASFSYLTEQEKVAMAILSLATWLIYTLLSIWRVLSDLKFVSMPGFIPLIASLCMMTGAYGLTRTQPPAHVTPMRVAIAFASVLVIMSILSVFENEFLRGRIDLPLISHVAAVITGIMAFGLAILKFRELRKLPRSRI
jgi:hypothetical protein